MKRSILELSRPRLLLLMLLMTSLPHPMCTGLSYCVSPRGLDESYQGQACKNFSEYLQNASFFFQSNSIFYFVNGTHFVDLNGTLLIQNAINISLVGVGGFKQTMHPIMGAFSESLSKVVFISSSLLFENIENLTIINITFTEHGSLVGQMDSPNVAILRLYDVKNFLIARSLFSNISGASINFIGSVAVVMDSYFLHSSTALEAHEASMIGCDHCTIVGSKCAVNFTDSTFSAEQSTIAYCTNGVVSYALSYMYVTTLSLNECNFLACTNAVSLIDIGLATVVQCAFINCTVGVDAVHIYDQISLYQCNFLSTGYPLVATTISNLIVEQCTFTDAITGVNASDSSAQLWQCSFTSCANGLIAYAPNVYSRIKIMDCNFTTCSTGLTVDLINIAIIGRCAMSHVNYSIAAHGSLVGVVQSVFTAYISAGMFVSSEIYIESCTFTMGKSSTIYSVESYIILHDSVSFSNGYSSGYGGTMYLSGSSVIFKAPVNVSFINNTAQLSGGAIYVEYQHSQAYCFFSIYDPDGTLETPNVHLLFTGNSAREAGNDIYASLKCPIDSSGIPLYHSEKQTSESIVRAVSSPALGLAADPTVVCIGEPSTYALSECSDNQTSPPYTVQLYPGQYTTVSIATLDEYNGRAPSLLFLRNTNRIIFETLWSQAIGTNYTINSSLQNVTFELIPQAVFISALSGDTNATLISVQVLPCPLGFTFNSSNGSCECNAFLSEQQGVWCNVSNFQIDDVQIYKPSKSWLGTINGALAFHEVCSFDYCNGVTAVDLRKQDDQCATNHSGPLCRGCADGLSEMFGGSQCKKCDNLHLLLLVPFAAMGVALVFALLTLNLTVSNGTLNGFIFYANIVKINESAFLQGSNSVLIKIISIFISWLNLDLGIVTCFYDRMSTAGRLGLQFVFPVYILMLVGLIVTAGRYSTRVSNLCRHNVVPVLATLVLLTYGKLLKTVIDILSIDYIAVAMDNNRTTVTYLYVWKYNANIIYLHSSHVPLFIMALLTVLLLFILPYAILLLLTPCIQTKSDWKILNWVNKLKPFIDSYEGPYIGRHRFWSGLLILIRIPIYVSSALVEITNSSFNLSVAMFFIAALVIYLARFNVYKNVKYCYLEMFLYINLIGLCLFSLLYRSRAGYDQDANSTQSLSELHFSYITFVGSVLIVFVAVIVLQEYHQIRKAKRKYTTVPKLTSPELTDPESDESVASSSHTVALSHENEKESDTGYREELLDD